MGRVTSPDSPPTDAATAAHHARVRRRAFVRLGLFATVVIAIGVFVTFSGVVDIDRAHLQAQIKDFGVLAPLVFVAVAGGFGALFVPAPLFAILGGALFGPFVGIPLGICGSIVCALIGREVGAHLGRDAAEEVAGGRLVPLASWLDRYGLRAVVALRLMPAAPDALLNYAAGLTRLHRWQVGLGTAIGAIPRTLGWGLVGVAIAGGSAWLGTGGGVLVVATDALAAVAVIVVARRLGIGPRSLWASLRQRPAV
jgi:uncharacterized membrane protein YdjX (TVP38/TMEM64 family)